MRRNKAANGSAMTIKALASIASPQRHPAPATIWLTNGADSAAPIEVPIIMTPIALPRLPPNQFAMT